MHTVQPGGLHWGATVYFFLFLAFLKVLIHIAFIQLHTQHHFSLVWISRRNICKIRVSFNKYMSCIFLKFIKRFHVFDLTWNTMLSLIWIYFLKTYHLHVVLFTYFYRGIRFWYMFLNNPIKAYFHLLLKVSLYRDSFRNLKKYKTKLSIL